MTSNSLIGPAPKFEKCVHHVVPQGWQRRFTAPGKAGPIYKDVITGVMRGPEGPGDKMSEEYVNIIFDDYFRPSDALEDRLAKIEDRAFKALDRVIAAAQIESSDKVDLAYFIALQASRYPELYNDRLDLGRYLAIELQDATVRYPDASAFNHHLKASGVLPGACFSDAEFIAFSELSDVELAEQLSLLVEAQGYEAYFHPGLVIDGAFGAAGHLLALHWSLLEDSSIGFILSDRPVPAKLGLEFSVGLSAGLGLRISAPTQPANDDPVLSALASPSDVHAVNLEVRGRAQKLICGAGSWVSRY